MEQGLPKEEILKKRKDFRRVLEHGKSWQSEHLRFFYKKANQRQVGFAVPKRLGKAVQRNRVKRLLREVYRMHRHAIESWQILVIAKDGARGVGLREIEREFVKFLDTNQKR